MNEHGKLRVEVFVDAMFQENALLMWCAGEREAWIVDPGFPPQPQEITEALGRLGLSAKSIMLTHCHPDHIAGIKPLRESFPDIEIVAPASEERMLVDSEANLSAAMGFAIEAPPASRLVSAGGVERLGALNWKLLDVSGHSPGGLAYYCSEVGVVIGGDALFAGSIGRYDFPGSSRRRLLKNIRENLLTLPGETVLYSGHGPLTTIGEEKETNPVLLAELAEL